MIILLNSFNASYSFAVARELKRLEGGPAEVLLFFPAEETPGELRGRLQSFGRISSAVASSFDSGQTLKQCRGMLGELDDEVYAFRLSLQGGVSPQNYQPWHELQTQESRFFDMGFELPASEDPCLTAQAVFSDIHELITLEEYNPAWLRSYLMEEKSLLAACGPLLRSIEHVGSTAVPGLLSKPIIDLLITVSSLEKSTGMISPLSSLGYAFIDYPQNIDKRFFRKGKPRSHNLHVVEHGSADHNKMVGFRDALRANPVLRERYCELKRSALKAHPSRRALYGAQKSAFIREVLEQGSNIRRA